MEKTVEYKRTKFDVETIRTAIQALRELSDDFKKDFTALRIAKLDGTRWNHDSLEEFFADYREDCRSSHLDLILSPRRLIVDFKSRESSIHVEAESRHQIESIFEFFERSRSKCHIADVPELEAPSRVFIGHGRDKQWEELKNHLQDKHHLQVVAYEVGARAGHTIRDILQEMLQQTEIAFLVLTGEDETNDGRIFARQNVIHELGLFQGRLGFSRAIAILEEGTEEFSNLDGIQQIRFSKNRIKETFGDVLATIKREL